VRKPTGLAQISHFLDRLLISCDLRQKLLARIIPEKWRDEETRLWGGRTADLMNCAGELRSVAGINVF
jgi:hypothetical protein